MKKSNVITIMIAAIIVLTTACSKYEEGPTLSLASKKGRVANTWELEGYYEDGVDKTSEYREYVVSKSLEIDKEGAYTQTATASPAFGGATTTFTGTWEFINDKEEIKMVPTYDPTSTDTLVITRLKQNELWVKSKSGSPVEETHYKSK